MTDEKKASTEQEVIWDYFQNEGVDAFDASLPRLRYLVSQISSGLTVLNIGIGGGILEREALKKNIDIYSLDPNERAIETVKSEYQLSEKAQVGYSDAIPFSSGLFDVVVMSEVLEHLDVSIADKSFSEIHRVLKLNGLLFITVPFEERLNDSVVVCANCSERNHRWGHKQSFTIETLQNLIENKDFTTLRIISRCFPDWQRKGTKNFLKSCIRYILGRFGAAIAQPNIYAVCKKSN